MNIYENLQNPTTRGQFHQRFMYSFYAHKSQLHKNTVKLSVFFAVLGSASVKASCM